MTQQCEYAKLINACIEGTLDEERTEALFAHMAEHPECQALFDATLGMSDVLSSFSAEVPEGFSASVMEKVRAEASAKAKKPFPLRRTISLAVAAAAVVALVFFGASRLDISGKKSASSESVSAVATAGAPENSVIAAGGATAGFSVMTSDTAAAGAGAQSSSGTVGSSFFASQKSASADAYTEENSIAEESEAESVSPPEEPGAFTAAAEPHADGAASENAAPEAAEGKPARQADENGFVHEDYNAYVEIHGEVPEAFAGLEVFYETDNCIYYLIPPAMLEKIDYDYIERYEYNSTPVLAAVFPGN